MKLNILHFKKKLEFLLTMIFSIESFVCGEPIENVSGNPVKYLDKQINIEGYAACPECYQMDNGGCSGVFCVGDLVLQKEEYGGPAVIIYGRYNGFMVACASDGCVLKSTPLDLGAKYRVWGRIKRSLSKDPAKAFALAIDSFKVLEKSGNQQRFDMQKMEMGTGIQGIIYSPSDDSSGIWILLKCNNARMNLEDPVDTINKGKFSGHFFSGLKVGKWIEYYSNGKIQSTGNYLNGAKDGEWKEYDSSGMLKSMEEFSSGRETGLWKSRIPGGLSFAEIDYGNIDKSIFKKHYKDSTIEMAASINRFTETVDRIDTYYPEGTKKRSTKINPENQTALIEQWLPNGKKIYFFSAKKGVLTDSIWYDSGKLWKARTRDSNGKSHEFVEFREDGSPIWKGSYKGLRPNGTWTEFFTSGLPKRKISYTNGINSFFKSSDSVSVFTNKYFVEPMTGLSGITAIAAEKNGVWVATENGAAFFTHDGIFRKKFTTAQGLPGNRISAIAYDDSEGIWFGVEHDPIEACPTGNSCCISVIGTPLAKLSAETGLSYSSNDSFSVPTEDIRTSVALFSGAKWSYYDSVSDTSYIPPVSSIVITADGRKWYSSLNGIRCISHSIPETLKYRLFQFTGKPAAGSDSALWIIQNDSLYKVKGNSIIGYKIDLVESAILALRPEDDRNVLILTADSILRFNGKATVKILSFKGMKAVTHSQLDLESDGSLVFVTDQGLIRFKKGKITFIVKTSDVGGGNITCFTHDSSSYWVGTRSGLYRIIGSKILPVSSPAGPEAAYTSICAVGRSGILYVYVNEKGIYRWNGDSWRRFDIPNQITSGEVQTVCQGADSQFFVGTSTGLVRFDGKTYSKMPIKSELALGSITMLSRDSQGYIRYVLDQYRVVRFDGVSFVVEHELIPTVDGAITAFLKDKKGKIWLAGRDGLSVFSGDSLVKTFTTADGLPLFPITQIFESQSGVIYARSIESVYRLNGKRWNPIATEDNINGSMVTGVSEDKNGSLWIGTRNGLCLFENDGGTYMSIKTGLLDKRVNSIVTDKYGILWVATDKGLSRITPR